MKYAYIDKKYFLPEGIDIHLDIEIPLSDSAIIPEDNSFMESTLANQCITGLKSAIEDYKRSELPNAFLTPQEITITNKMPLEIYGAFTLIGDEMFVDADAISDIKGIQSSFLFAHETGHKIEKYRDLSETYEAIASTLGIGVSGNELLLKEIFADACGSIAVPNTFDSWGISNDLEEERCKHIMKLSLKGMYHI